MPTGYTLAVDNAATGRVERFAHTRLASFIVASQPPPFAPASATIAQVLATTPGTRYRVDVWALVATTEGGRLTVTFGGTTVFDAVLDAFQAGFTYQEFSGAATATGSSTELALSGAFANGVSASSFFLDDLSVVAIPSTVREPAPWALVGAGLAGVAGVARRRRPA